ncbi:methyltransferase domain-containing protein [Geobacter luticola]|uniref:Methyltransferase domain-containing protein n=1 Tax=Geomobilimonas luticola TaxID=1114878 RepID=A0ABS5SIW6_9BACT|nr:methyltransferase domain-containing protein [Geomobilimonas luticola]
MFGMNLRKGKSEVERLQTLQAENAALARQVNDLDERMAVTSATLRDVTAHLANLTSFTESMRVFVENMNTYVLNLNDNVQSHIVEKDAGLEAIKLLMTTREMIFRSRWQDQPQAVLSRLMAPQTFDEYHARLQALLPEHYRLWSAVNMSELTENYRNDPSNNCGVSSRYATRLFAGFIAPYLHGRVLDVGCGPWPVGEYLLGYPVGLISGLDPLPPYEPHPFEFVQGFAEFLPWQDDTFDVIIAATSLDHTLSLNTVLAEIRRVLKLGGYLLTWDFFDNNLNKPYHPENEPPAMVDPYHLFHFSESWHDPLMEHNFNILEKLNLNSFDPQIHDFFHSMQLIRK